MADREFLPKVNQEKKDLKDNFQADVTKLDTIIAPGPRTLAEQRADSRTLARITKRLLKRVHQG